MRDLTRSTWHTRAATLACAVAVGTACSASTAPKAETRVWSGGGMWEQVSTGPTPPRVAPIVVWTGHEILVWGGVTDEPTMPGAAPGGGYPPGYQGHSGTPLLDGASFDPTTRQWSPIPNAPVPFLGFEVSASWTGDDLLVWGSDRADIGRTAGARYNPSTKTWRRMADQTVIAFGTGTWTGTDWIVVGGTRNMDVAAAAYRPKTDSWRALPSPPTRNSPEYGRSLPAWTGTELLLGLVATADAPLLFDPAGDQWRTAPASPFGKRFDTRASWTGDVMIETGRTVQPAPGDDILTTADGYARFDPARNRWDSMQAPTRAVAKGQTIDHHAVFDGEPGAPLLAYDGRADRWDSLPAPPAAGTLIWTGTDLWSVAGGGPAGRPGGVYRYRPS